MYPQPAQRVHYPALDLLRGVAIAAVVLFHCFDSVSFFRFGWMGVDLFFVLSGFLITDLLLCSLNDKHYFRNFFMRRVLRIFPLYYLVLLAFFIGSPLVFKQQGPHTTYAYFNNNEVWFWTHFQNWLMVQNGPAPVPYLTHFWSLGVEEQFYLFWPFVLFVFRKPGRLKAVIVLLIVLAVGLRCFTRLSYPHFVEAYYCNTFTRMDSLLMGSLLAVHLKQGKLLPAGLVKGVLLCFALLVAASLTLFGNLSHGNVLFSTVGYTVSAAFFACTLYLFIQHSQALKQGAKRLAPLQFIGKISYGIYVFHVPVYLLFAFQFSSLFNSLVGDRETAGMLVSVVSIGLTVAVSAASFYLLEKPILRLKRHFS